MRKLAFGFALALGLLGAEARADIPAGYTGTPFGGTPRAIPGRIDFEDYDDGGQDVGWRVDDHTGNFGDSCAGNAYRTVNPHPELCKTNTSPGENDVYTSGPMMGQHYPSDAMPQSIYVGFTHGVDWVKVTVNVAKAGTYKLSSTWGSEPGGADAIKMEISFNDVVKANVSLPGTGGYHNWVAAPDFGMVELEAGVQVLKFAPKSQHLNYDYLQFSLVLPGGGVDDGTGNAGGTGAGGAASGGAGGAAGAAGVASGGTFGSSGSGAGGTGSSPFPVSGSGGAGPTGGTGPFGLPTAGTGSGVTPTTSGADDERDSSCRVSPGTGSAGALSALFGAAALSLVLGRRSRRQR